jgi:hypothetical protein
MQHQQLACMEWRQHAVPARFHTPQGGHRLPQQQVRVKGMFNVCVCRGGGSECIWGAGCWWTKGEGPSGSCHRHLQQQVDGIACYAA